jgi:hypothetical protein
MAKQQIDIGVQGNDGTGDSIREAFRKVNDNFTDLYAVFGAGGQINSTDLDDMPSSYTINQVFITNSTGDAVLAKTLSGGAGIDIDTSALDEIVISSTSSSIDSDASPSLGGPLNGTTFPIGNIAVPSPAALAQFNAVHATNYTIDTLVINKGYADRRYIQQAGGGAAGQLRVRNEPADQTAYTKTISSWANGNAVITAHGFDSGSDGIAFKFNSSVPLNKPSNLTVGTIYYLRYVSDSQLSVHPTVDDAKNDTNKIIVSYTIPGGTSNTFVDAYLDITLSGNWISNEALPRISTVRRQGDTMTGTLLLSDHPGTLAGAGAPNGPDDLQAATKYYVDNSSFASNINLFVSTSGDDTQANTPAGKEGRAFAYAYSTIGAACAKAVELIDLASTELGPYRQSISYTLLGVRTDSIIQSVTITGGNSTYTPIRDTLNANREYIRAEVIGYLNTTEPDLIYNSETCSRDIGIIIDAIIIDALVDGNYQSVNAGRAYFKNASAKVASGTQQLETVAGISYAKYLAGQVLQGLAPVTSYQTVYTRVAPIGSVTSPMRTFVAASFDIITNIITNGTSAAPNRNYGSGLYSVVVNNGGLGHVDQGSPTNIDITPGKLIQGVLSRAVARIVSYTPDSATDTISASLLTPYGFQENEKIEFADANKDLQITIRVESGIYYEDYPIKVPANVAIKGDEFRRTILRPKDRASQSPWIETYFYRDVEFDGLSLAPAYNPNAITLLNANKSYLRREIIEWIDAEIVANNIPFVGFTYDPTRVGQNIINIIDAITSDIKFGGNGESYDTAALFYNGATPKIPGQTAQYAAAVSQLRVIINSFILTNTPYTSLQTVEAQTINSNNGEAVAITQSGVLLTAIEDVIDTGLTALPAVFDSPKYGKHYLVDSTRDMNVGTSYANAGGYVRAAKLIEINKAFIQAEVTAYVAVQPGVITFDQDLSLRDTGLIVDAIVADLIAGGKANVVDVASRFYGDNVGSTVTQAACIAGMTYINTLAQKIIDNVLLTGAPTPTVPPKRSTVTQIRDTSIIKETASVAVIASLVGTVVFAFDPAYNPPKNNKELDVFMFNDAVKLHNITAQGHGGFMCVLDPAGIVGSKSPYVQSCGCFSRSINQQTFAGGMFIDGFSGRLHAVITTVNSTTQLTLSDLTQREPVAPTSFYYNGFRYQVDNIVSWNPTTGIAVINLNPTTPWSSGTLNITLETPGNRSMLANDFTQVNDLGYGIVAHNAGLTEQVSTFTYYCWTAYLASYGGQIRSVAGSNAHGQYGLKSVGADPTEVPDQVTLADNMTQVAKIYRFSDYSDNNQKSDTTFYLKRYSYVPSSVSEVEIDHLNGTISRYELRSVTRTGVTENTYSYRITAATTASTCVITVGASTLPLTITGISKAEPGVVSVGGSHGLSDGDFITITGVVGMVQINNGSYYIKSTGAGTFELYKDSALVVKLDTSAFTAWSSGGSVASPIKFYSGDRIKITGVGGMTELNGNKYYVKPLTYRTFELYSNSALTTPIASTGYTTYTSGGVVNENFTYDISAVTNTNPARVTFTEDHHYNDGDLVKIENALGMIRINGSYYAKVYNANTIELYSESTLVTSINTTNVTTYPAYTGSGTLYGGREVLAVTLSTSANDNRESTGLFTQVSDHMNVSIRELQNFRFNDIDNVNPTRPSTALEFDATLPDVYRITSYGQALTDGSALPANSAMLTSDTSFSYIKPATISTQISTTDPIDGAKKLGSQVGDIRIAIYSFEGDSNTTTRDLLNSETLQFAWSGKVHRILSYTEAAGLVPAYITIDDVSNNNNFNSSTVGLATALSTTSSTTFRAGLPSGSTGAITVKISTCRVTGHDFLDIGTGGYNTTNYPTTIFGNAAQAANQSNEVIEEFKGRVFYVSTDQNGIFRVGRFFTVDQGTGTVTFSASIALSNLDGLGFKAGVTVSEFSTDSTFTNNASDAVPVQAAVRGYIDKRLGIDHGGNPVPVGNKIGPGYLPVDGSVEMTAPLNLAGNRILNIGSPSAADDAANKAYVDDSLAALNELGELTDVTIATPATGNVLVYDNDNSLWKNAELVGDVALSFDTGTGVLTAAIQSDVIINDQISTTAAIEQSKLAMNSATTRADATGITQADLGLASFNSSAFDITSGWVSLKDAGTSLGKIATISDARILGNFSGAAASPIELTASTVGAKSLEALFTTNGALTRTGSETFAVVTISTSGGADSLVKTDANGIIDVKGVKINSSSVNILDVTSTTVAVNTPGSVSVISASGTTEANTNVVLTGQFTLGASSTFVASSATTAGTATNANNLNVGGLYRAAATAATANTIAARDASGDLYANLFQGTATSARYADLAEYYTTDQEYAPGTVLVFGGVAETTTTNIFSDSRLAGVVSTAPGYIMNSELVGTRACIALQGRVPCKVVGQVKKGDMLTTAGIPGHAAKAMDPRVGTIIGKALEDKDYSEAGVIEVAVGRV